MTEHSAEQAQILGRAPFYLTQRLTRRDHAVGKGGFDALFACQYMGAAEFEWGALPESLGRIRAAKRRLAIHVGTVTRNGATKPVFVVGDRRRIEAVPAALTAWMEDRYPHGKESTFFPEQVDDTTEGWHRETHAWWALRSDVMWTLRNDIAHDLLRGIRG